MGELTQELVAELGLEPTVSAACNAYTWPTPLRKTGHCPWPASREGFVMGRREKEFRETCSTGTDAEAWTETDCLPLAE